MTVYPNVPLYAYWLGEERVPGKALPFRTRITILPGPWRDRVLVRVGDGSQCGYVESAKILSGQPLKVIDIDADEQVRVSIFGVPRNNWTVRALLRSNPKLGTTPHEGTLFDAPEGRPFQSSRIFRLFNVFKVEKRGTDPDDWWYFVGGQRVADDKVLSGWVRGGNLFLWGSGMAVYPSADKGAPFDVYTDVETLKKSAKEGLLATRSGLEPPADRDIAKLPILDQIFKNANRDRKAGIPPIAYEIGFFGQGCDKDGKCYDAQTVGDKLKDGPFLRLGLTPEEVERVLNLRQLTTKGYVAYDPQKRNIAFFAAMEPDRFSLFQGSLIELCRAMSEDDDLRNRMLGLMLTLAHNLGGSPYDPTETISEYLDRITFIPKRHFASWLHRTANEFGNEWGSGSYDERKTKLKLSACRSAYLLQQMGAGQKVESMDDLDFDAQLGRIQLKPGRSPRTYNWLWSTESKIELYFVPTAYLPQDWAPPAPVQKSVVAAGPPVTVLFGSPTSGAKERLKHSGKVPNEDGIFFNVDRQQLQFTLPPESGLAISRCDAKRLACRFDAERIELLPRDGEAVPKLVRVDVEFASIQRKASPPVPKEAPRALPPIPPRPSSLALPPSVLLKPAVRLGRRLLPLQSCKVTLAGVDASFAHKRDGTLATFGKGASLPKAGSYAVKVIQGPDAAAVCHGLVAEGPVAAAKLSGLGADATLSIPVRRSGSRAFVGIVSLPKELRSKGESWQAALVALRDAFDTGAKESRYLWGAVYGPDGKALVTSESADYAPLDIESEVLKSAAKMKRLAEGAGLVAFDALLDLAAKDVADLEGNVDMLIVAETARATCGWSTPPHAKGSRAALVRLVSFSSKKGSSEVKGMGGVRLCDYNERSDKAGVVAEVEVVPGEWSAEALPHALLKRVIADVAGSLLKH